MTDLRDTIAAVKNAEDTAHDEYYVPAKSLLRENPTLTVAMLQRRLRLGYPRAYRLLEYIKNEDAARREGFI